VKLPEARVTELAEQRIADRMVIGARALREWAVIDVDAGAERWETLVSEAFAYLDRITP
jgi:hypothetical protein